MKEAFDLIRKEVRVLSEQEFCKRRKQEECDKYFDCETCLIDSVIQIVSKVEAEYGKDVCEWRWGIDRAMVQCKGDYIIFESRRLFSFCPYCGKKIKEVE